MSGTVCSVDRYHISDLAALLQNSAGKLAKEDVAEVLSRSVNIPGEKLSKEHRQKFTAENSTSAFEASSFIIKLMVTGQIGSESAHAKIARGLDRVFFGGTLFEELPPRHVVKIDKCHDGDTCTFVETQPASCNAGPSTVSVRISGTDAPEVGAESYTESGADATRGKDSPYGKKPGNAPAGGAWINGKLVGNVDAVHKALAVDRWDPKKISYKEREAINNIIAATIDYTGRIATVPRADLLSWEMDGSTAGAELLMRSQWNWTSADTPELLCGKVQYFDTYGRIIASFAQQDPTRLARYLRTRLSVAMAGAAPQLKAEYIKRIGRFLKVIEGSSNPKLKEVIKGMIDRAPDAAKIYSPENCAKMADLFDAVVKQFGGVGADDDQLMQIATGSVYAYLKYRNQYGDLYEAAGDLAREKNIGLWGETTFRTLWETNARNPRYDPPDCRKR